MPARWFQGSRFARHVTMVCLIVMPCHTSMTLAQNSVSGSLRGAALDATDRAAIVDATVRATNNGTGATWSTLTFDDGSYRISLLSSGEYTITCEHPDYESSSSGPIYISLVKPTTLKVPPFLLYKKKASDSTENYLAFIWKGPSFITRRLPTLFHSIFPTSTLQIPFQIHGATPQSAAWNAPAVPQISSPPGPQQPPLLPAMQSVQMINSENALRGGNFDTRQLSSLPLPGIRTFDSLAFLLPGVTESPRSIARFSGPGIGAGVGTSGQFSVNGMRSRANSFNLDGSDNNDQDVAVRRQGFLSLLPQPVESIQEVHIATLLWDAELGRNLGSQVNAITTSGTNKIRGQVYGYFTDSSLNARNFFDYTGGPSERENRFTRVQGGFSVGGPLVRERTQFHASMELQAINATQEEHFTTPSSEQRRFLGLPRFKVITSEQSVNKLIDYATSAGATPLGLNLLSLYPLPNNPTGPFQNNTFSRVLPASGQGVITAFKINHRFGPGHGISGRYNFSDDFLELPSIGRAIGSTIDSDARFQNLSLIADNAFSPTLVNQARFSVVRHFEILFL